MRKLRNKVIRWNNKFPWDLWWRRFNNEAYGSEVHRNTCFSHMIMQIAEHIELERIRKKDEIDQLQYKKEAQEMFDDVKLEDFYEQHTQKS